MKTIFFIKNKFKTKFIILIAVIIAILIAPFMYISAHTKPVATSPADNTKIKLPVIMYHMISKDQKAKNKFVVSANDFEEDLKYIKSNNYNTILVKDIIDYVEGKSELPPNPILLTFDDGALNNYLYAFPIAKKHNCKFVFSPIACEVERYSKIKDENPSYAYADWDKIKEMSDSGLVEIQNHTYNMHHTGTPRMGCTKRIGESKEHYTSALTQDLQKSQNLIEAHTGVRPTAFFYPYGACGKYSEETIKSLEFKATFSCEEKINEIYKNPDCLFKIGRFLRPPGVSSQKFFSKIIK